jgi:hypothetical protein
MRPGSDEAALNSTVNILGRRCFVLYQYLWQCLFVLLEMRDAPVRMCSKNAQTPPETPAQ